MEKAGLNWDVWIGCMKENTELKDVNVAVGGTFWKFSTFKELTNKKLDCKTSLVVREIVEMMGTETLMNISEGTGLGITKKNPYNLAQTFLLPNFPTLILICRTYFQNKFIAIIMNRNANSIPRDIVLEAKIKQTVNKTQ